MVKYKKYITIIFALLMLAPILMGLPIKAQGPYAEITSSGPIAAVPGQIIEINVTVYSEGYYTIALVDTGMFYPEIYNYIELYLFPGEYTFRLSLPEEMPGTYVTPYIYIGTWPTPIWAYPSPNTTEVFPKLIVTPTITPNVDALGNNKTLTIKGTGFEPGSVIDTIYAECLTSSCGGLVKSWSISPAITVPDSGVFEVEVSLGELQPTPYLARGKYLIETYDARGYSGNSTLLIVPQILLSTTEGFGAWKAPPDNVTIYGYGFSADATIKLIKFSNTNFTNIYYEFEPVVDYSPRTSYYASKVLLKTDDSGYFEYTFRTWYWDSKNGIWKFYWGFGTNMTAGLYNITVVEAPIIESITKSSTFTINKTNYITFTTLETEAVFGTSVLVNVTATIIGSDLRFIPVATNRSFILDQVLAIDFTYLGKDYRITATRWIDTGTGDHYTRYELLNMTGYPAIPPVSLFVHDELMTYDSSIGANVSAISFTPGYPSAGPGGTEPVSGENLAYKFSALFYEYTNQIFLVLKERSREIYSAVASVYYKNYDTGTEKTFTGNMTIGTDYLTYTTDWFSDHEWRWKVTLVVARDTLDATATLEGYVIREDTFRAPGYLVRPRLAVEAGQVLPGEEITILATGFGPGKFYTGTENILTLRLDNSTYPVIIVDAETSYEDNTVVLGRDGNVTFVMRLPEDLPFGAHWLWGKDIYGYEYTLMLIVGAKNYFVVLVRAVISKSNVVSAAPETEVTAAGMHVGLKLEACPCEEFEVTKVCGFKVSSAIPCDYLGDEIVVNGSGFSPGTEVKIFLRPGEIWVAKATVREDGSFTASFIVPTIPAGEYQVVIKTPTEEYIAQFFNGTYVFPPEESVLIVKPKVLLTSITRKDLMPILSGPGLVRVIGTGFKPGTVISGLVVNNTEVLFTLNTHITGWSVDSNGVLRATTASVEPALYIPFSDEGIYEVALVYREPGAPEPDVSTPGYVVVANKVLHEIPKVLTGLGSLRSLIEETILPQVTSTANVVGAIQGDVSVIKGTVEAIVGVLGKLDTIESKVSSIEGKLGKLDDIYSAVTGLSGQLNNVLIALQASTAALNASVTQLAASVGEISAAVSTIKDQIIPLLSNLATKDDVNAITTALAPALEDISSGISSISDALSSVSADVSAIKSQTADVATKADVEAVKTDIGGKVDAIMPVLYVAVVLALLAFIFALLAYTAARRK